jgi:hypothetical protein
LLAFPVLDPCFLGVQREELIFNISVNLANSAGQVLFFLAKVLNYSLVDAACKSCILLT